MRHIWAGAERAGRDWQSLDIGAWVVFATGFDFAAAREAARSMVGIYASSMPEEQLRRNGVAPASSNRSSTPSPPVTSSAASS